MKKENLRDNKTNKLLTKSLIDLLEEKDFSDIKINEICDHALVHKTTFYNHFDDKYDLLNYIIKELYQEINEQADNSNGILKYYLSIAKIYIKKIKENPKLFKSIIKSGNNEISLSIFYNLYIKDIEKNINELNIQIPSNYIAKFYVNAVFAITNEWFINGMVEDEETIIKYIESLIKEPKDINL